MKLKIALCAAALAVTVPVAAFAHHSFAMFDQTKEVELKNVTVVTWQWTAPHVWLYVMTPDSTKYSLEGGNPGALRRDGYGKGTFKPGDKVSVYIAPLKDGRAGGSIKQVILANGTTLGARDGGQRN